jgi:hypothetical protein
MVRLKMELLDQVLDRFKEELIKDKVLHVPLDFRREPAL